MRLSEDHPEGLLRLSENPNGPPEGPMRFSENPISHPEGPYGAMRHSECPMRPSEGPVEVFLRLDFYFFGYSS